MSTGAELGQDREQDELVAKNVDGVLDADLAELSLGQRLTAVQGVMNGGPDSHSDSDSEELDSDSSSELSESELESEEDVSSSEELESELGCGCVTFF